MDNEKLTLATALNSEIKEIKSQIENLEQSSRINTESLDIQVGYFKTKYIDFNLFKTITLAQLKELLVKKENEFFNL